MKVKRNSYRLFSRRPQRRSGCASLLVLLLVTMAVVVLGRHWIGLRLNQNRNLGPAVSLPDAFAAFNKGDLKSAVEFAHQLLERDGADVAVYELLVRALIYRSYSDVRREDDRAKALEASREAIRRLPRDLDMQALHGYALQATGSAEEAGRIALRIVEREPDHILARIVLSLSYGARGIAQAALREAETGLEFALKQRRYELESHRAMALAYGDMGNYRAALAELDKAVAYNGKLIPLHFEKALFALQVGDVDQATVSYFTIMAMSADNVKARTRLCELSERLQERDAALRYCQEVTALAPLWDDGWYALGRLRFLDGDYEQAKSAFGRCSRLQVEGGVAIQDRQLDCWYLQGQSAEIIGDCDSLTLIYREFQDMAREAGLPQTWSYPPDGPPICAGAVLRARQAASP